MVLLSIFYESDLRRDHPARLFFIHLSLHALALHPTAVKILLQIFLYEDLSTLALHTSVGCISSECQQDRTLLRNQYY